MGTCSIICGDQKILSIRYNILTKFLMVEEELPKLRKRVFTSREKLRVRAQNLYLIKSEYCMSFLLTFVFFFDWENMGAPEG